MKHISRDFIFHATTIDEAVVLLSSNSARGLTKEVAKERVQRFGYNTIAEAKKLSSLRILVNQFKSPIVFLLLFAAGMSFWFKEWLDAIAILIVLMVNAAIGFYMEFKAQQSMMALRRLASIPAKVVRNGQLMEINAEEIVPGDMLYVEAGDMVAADGIICRATQFLVDESALTGESVPVEKKPGVLPSPTILGDRTNMAFKGTYVSKGNAFILVCSTGMETELGKIAVLIQTSEQAATPLEKKIEQFSKKLIRITIVLVIIIFIAGLLNGQHILEMMETAIALAVAAIPEGLPIVATMCLAQGMLRMARHNVIVKKLSAVETLGGTNVICTDKTGTLTQNKMEVVQVITGSETWDGDSSFTRTKQLDLIATCAVLCNTADIQTGEVKTEIGDPLEIALLKFAYQYGEDVRRIRREYSKMDEVPFSSETKIMATLHEHENMRYVFAKGAAEELILKCSHIFLEDQEVIFTDEIKKAWIKKADENSSSGYRIIGMAYRTEEYAPSVLTRDLVFIGLVGMIDPPRPEVFSAINECKTAGIKVVMITGDHPSTAHYIGKKLGISSDNEAPLIGKDMKEFEFLDEPEKQRWINTSVFARVNPKHKLDLVKVFQEKGYVVGMTGDGVNDAPALKKSDIGIAMGQRGTQVAQEAADMVLKDDSFSSIVVAINQGRVIFENIKKFVTFLLSCNLSELLVIAVAAVMNLHFQLVPLQILFINLITDVLPALALGATKGSVDIMKEKPRSSSMPIVDNQRWKLIFFYSIIIAFSSIAAVSFNHYMYHNDGPWGTAMCNNILFFTLIISQLLHVFNMGKGSFFKSEVTSNKFVWYSVGASVVILFSVIQIASVRQALKVVSMTSSEWVIILTASGLSVFVIQVTKYLKLFK